MKKTMSFIRFVLLMIGGAVLTLVMLVSNAWAARNGRRNGGDVPQPRSDGETAAVEPAVTNQSTVVLNLKDGARLTGEPVLGSLTVKTGYATPEIPWTRVRRLRVRHDSGTVIVYTRQGETITGTPQPGSLEIATELGKLSIPYGDIVLLTSPAAVVAAKPEEETVDELIDDLGFDRSDVRARGAKGLAAKGQEVVPTLTQALRNSNPTQREQIVQVLATLGWYVTRQGAVEKMSESREFREMMRKRLPEMEAE